MDLKISRLGEKITLSIDGAFIQDVFDYKIISSADEITELTIKIKNPGIRIVMEGASSAKT